MGLSLRQRQAPYDREQEDPRDKRSRTLADLMGLPSGDRSLLFQRALARSIRENGMFNPREVESYMEGVIPARLELAEYLRDELDRQRTTGGDGIHIGLSDAEIAADALEGR